jgi:PGF-pre-PGF domain-containing protein
VNVTWYINGTSVDTNTSTTSATYTNTSASVGVWNVSAVVNNTNGNDIQTWIWNVAAGPVNSIVMAPTSTSLNITEYQEFNVTAKDKYGNNKSVTFTWYTTPSGIGTLNATNGSVVNFTALHVGRTEIYAVNGSVSSNKTDSIWITVNALPEIEDVTNGTGNSTSGNSTAIVNLNNKSVNGTITIEEIGDPVNKTKNIANQTGLGTDSKPIKGANVTVTGNIEAALNATGGYVHLWIEYNESQLGNIDENTLYIYKFINGTGWVKLVAGNPSYCIASGRNTTANYVWVNVTKCSTFLLAGTPTAAPTPPSDDSSSGGGIGVGGSDEPENVEESAILRIYLQAGGSSTYNFNNVVTSVEVTPDRTYGLVAAKIEVLAGKPGSITTDPPAGVLFKYVNIFVGTSGWSEGKFSNSIINFQLPASWFEDNNIDPATVTLYRHYGDEWQPLATTMTGQAGEYYQYSSPTPGFSTFMILGQVEDSATGEPVVTPDSGTVAESISTPEATTTKGTPGFGILLGIMGVLVAVYSRRK